VKVDYFQFLDYPASLYDTICPLDNVDRANHLPQNKPAPIPVAKPVLPVIKMNSTFLECTDVHFSSKGFGTSFCILLLIITLCFPLIGVGFIVDKGLSIGLFLLTVLLALFSKLLTSFIIKLLKIESFNYTHYPMRFNRKTRMVHIFLEWQYGKILSIPWDDIYFTYRQNWFTSHLIVPVGGSPLSTCTQTTNSIVAGYQLSKDRKTILQTFALMSGTTGNKEEHFLQWEFVRQYMEGDDEKVAELAGMVDRVSNVAERRETFWGSFRQLFGNLSENERVYLGVLAFPITIPFFIFGAIGRQIAMWTSKIPRWPDEIEATCQVSPDDPNLRDDKHLAPYGTAQRPDVSRYAGR